MIKNIIAGIIVGIAAIIPGVSGGSMLVVLGLFNKLMDSLNNFIKINNPNRLKDFIFLFQVGIGGVIGVVFFANILTFLFEYYPNQTLFWFVGLVLFSIPTFVKEEMTGYKFNYLFLTLGFLFVFGIKFLAPSEATDVIITIFPKIDLIFGIQLLLIGMIVFGAMLVPGGNGSVLLLLIGQYYLFQAYVANVFTFKPEIIIPLIIISIGGLIGIFLSAKVISHFLDKYRGNSLNFILGLTIASALVLIPINGNYNLFVLLTSILSFVFGGLVVYILERVLK